MSSIRPPFTWNEREARKKQPCYRVNKTTGARTLINAPTVSQDDQLKEVKQKLTAAGVYSLAEINEILKRLQQ